MSEHGNSHDLHAIAGYLAELVKLKTAANTILAAEAVDLHRIADHYCGPSPVDLEIVVDPKP